MELIRIIKQKKYIRGPTPWPGGWGARPPLLGAPLSPGPPGGPPVSIFCYIRAFTLENIVGKLTGRNSAATRCSGRAVLPGKLPFGRGKSSPCSSPTILSSGGDQSPSTSSPAPSPLKTLVHLLYPILYQNHKLVPVGC